MTRLAGSSAIVLHTSELGSSDPVGLIVALLLEFSVSTAPSVLRGLADRETDLMCCARPSNGVVLRDKLNVGRISWVSRGAVSRKYDGGT
jgi:hypothetical protein